MRPGSKRSGRSIEITWSSLVSNTPTHGKPGICQRWSRLSLRSTGQPATRLASTGKRSGLLRALTEAFQHLWERFRPHQELVPGGGGIGRMQNLEDYRFQL